MGAAPKFRHRRDVKAAILSKVKKDDFLKKAILYSMEKCGIRQQNEKFQKFSPQSETHAQAKILENQKEPVQSVQTVEPEAKKQAS